MRDDIDLLQKEMDLLWGADLYGRPARPLPLVALAISTDGRAIRLGTGVGCELEQELPIRLGQSIPPPALRRCYEKLATRRSVRLDGGPSFVFDGVAGPSSSRRVVTSRDGVASSLAQARPEEWGDAEEWIDLLAGRLGPWAVGLTEARVASICYTPVAAATAAEAGIWTSPDERGKGWGADVTLAWAWAAAESFELLFYSTGFYNAASQAVARKLGVRPIGTIWQILEVAPYRRDWARSASARGVRPPQERQGSDADGRSRSRRPT